MSEIAMIGFGEAARAFVSGWRSDPDVTVSGITTFDVKIEDPVQRQSVIEAGRSLDAACLETREQALKGRSMVFSLVTADRALEAATQMAPFLEPDALYLDCNSCSPATKAQSAKIVEAAGAVYVDVAVMSPVHPALHRVPLLLSGVATTRAQATLAELGMKARIVGNNVGQASAIKMLRSVMIKGLEALTAECGLAARQAGVEEAVIASLQASDPGIDWMKRFAYNLERMMVHGKRRAAEMQEVAATLRELGLPDRMAAATTEWQDQIGDFGIRTEQTSLAARADAILERFPQ